MKGKMVSVELTRLDPSSEYDWKIFPCRGWSLEDRQAQQPQQNICDGCWMVCENKDYEIARIKRKLIDHVLWLVFRDVKRLEKLRKELENGHV